MQLGVFSMFAHDYNYKFIMCFLSAFQNGKAGCNIAGVKIWYMTVCCKKVFYQAEAENISFSALSMRLYASANPNGELCVQLSARNLSTSVSHRACIVSSGHVIRVSVTPRGHTGGIQNDNNYIS